MNIRLYILSKKPKKFYLKARNEYEKRLNRYCKISVKNFSSEDKLFKEIDRDNLLIIIDETGKQMSSEKLADKIAEAEISGMSKVTILIGPVSLDEYEGSIERIAVSRMTLSDDLLAVVTLEQIYRAYKIINGESYHK